MKRGLAVLVVLTAGTFAKPLHAETKRVRVPVDSLPRQVDAIPVAAKDAVLPDGAREGSDVPKSWRTVSYDDGTEELGHCTEGRRASVGNITNGQVNTEKIWESNGKVFFDRANVKIEEGKVHVVSAERRPVVYVTDSVWAYRRDDSVVLVFASDNGIFLRAMFYGCSVGETSVSLPAGSVTFDSSPERATDTMNKMLAFETDASRRKKRPPWKGAAFTGLASVSRASADRATMLNIVIQEP